MRSSIRSRLTFANVMVVILAFIVLGGGAYAATQLPANSVGTEQLQNGAVTGKKLNRKLLKELLKIIKHFSPKSAPIGPPGPKGEPGEPGPKGDPGTPGMTIPAGTTLRGAVGSSMATAKLERPNGTGASYSFGGFQLSARPLAHVVPPGGNGGSACPGSAEDPEAAAGNLCVYVAVTNPSGTGTVFVLDPAGSAESGVTYNLASSNATVIGDGRVSRFGFFLDYAQGTALTGATLRGTWAVTG